MRPTRPGIRARTIIMSPGGVITTAVPGRLDLPRIRRRLHGQRHRPPNSPARSITTPPEAAGARPAAVSVVPRAAALPDATPGHFAATRLARKGRGGRAYLPHSRGRAVLGRIGLLPAQRPRSRRTGSRREHA